MNDWSFEPDHIRPLIVGLFNQTTKLYIKLNINIFIIITQIKSIYNENHQINIQIESLYTL